jgi:chromosome segregation ATPase
MENKFFIKTVLIAVLLNFPHALMGDYADWQREMPKDVPWQSVKERRAIFEPAPSKPALKPSRAVEIPEETKKRTALEVTEPEPARKRAEFLPAEVVSEKKAEVEEVEPLKKPEFVIPEDLGLLPKPTYPTPRPPATTTTTPTVIPKETKPLPISEEPKTEEALKSRIDELKKQKEDLDIKIRNLGSRVVMAEAIVKNYGDILQKLPPKITTVPFKVQEKYEANLKYLNGVISELEGQLDPDKQKRLALLKTELETVTKILSMMGEPDKLREFLNKENESATNELDQIKRELKSETPRLAEEIKRITGDLKQAQTELERTELDTAEISSGHKPLLSLQEYHSDINKQIEMLDRFEQLKAVSDAFDAKVTKELRDIINKEISNADLIRNRDEIIKQISSKFEGLDEAGRKALQDTLSNKIDLARLQKQIPLTENIKEQQEKLLRQRTVLEKNAPEVLYLNKMKTTSSKNLKADLKALKSDLSAKKKSIKGKSEEEAQKTNLKIQNLNAAIKALEEELNIRKKRVKKLKKVTKKEYTEDRAQYIYHLPEQIKRYQELLDKANKEGEVNIAAKLAEELKLYVDQKKALEDKYGGPPDTFKDLKDAIRFNE